jgi:hypothetical protein
MPKHWPSRATTRKCGRLCRASAITCTSRWTRAYKLLELGDAEPDLAGAHIGA